MKVLTLAGLALASTAGLTGISVIGTAERGAQSAPAEGWLTDFTAAQAVSRQSGKPLFVLFR
jgi:hypothetical protein